MNYREHPIPKHWIPSTENPALPAVDVDFIKSFNDPYAELLNIIWMILLKEKRLKNRSVILNEYKVMVEQYAKFFDIKELKMHINVY